MRRILVPSSRLALENGVNLADLSTQTAASTADELEMAKDQAALDTDITGINEAADVMHALEELALALPAGELDPQTHKAVSIATEHMCARVGLAVSLEDATPGEQTAKWIANKVVVIWKAIVAALQRALQRFKGFIVRLMDMSGRVEKRAQALIAQLKKGGVETTGEELTNPRLAKALQVDGQFPDDLGLAAQRTAGAITALLESYTTQALYDADTLKYLTDPKHDFQYSAEQEKHKHQLKHKLEWPHDGKDAGELWASEPLLGDRQIEQALPVYQGELENHTALMWMLSTPRLGEGAKREHAVESMKVMTAPTLLRTAQAALQLASAVSGFRSHLTELEVLAGKLVAAAKTGLVNAQQHGAPSGYGVMKLKNQRTYLSQAPRWLVAEPTQFANYGVNTAHALLNYVEQCLRGSIATPPEVAEMRKRSAEMSDRLRETVSKATGYKPKDQTPDERIKAKVAEVLKPRTPGAK